MDTFNADAYQYSSKALDDVLEDLENNDNSLKSSFSGSSSPANLSAGQLWQHTIYGLRVRNNSSAWLKVLCGDASQKMWVYRNDTCEGWLVDSSVTDRVLAFKGGSNAYNVNGGNTAGTWMSPHTHGVGTYAVGAHCHQVYKAMGNNATDQHYNSAGTLTNFSATPNKTITSGDSNTYYGIALDEFQRTFVDPGYADNDIKAAPDMYSAEVSPSLSGASASGGTATTWRAAAAVGTLQYPNLS